MGRVLSYAEKEIGKGSTARDIEVHASKQALPLKHQSRPTIRAALVFNMRWCMQTGSMFSELTCTTTCRNVMLSDAIM